MELNPLNSAALPDRLAAAAPAHATERKSFPDPHSVVPPEAVAAVDRAFAELGRLDAQHLELRFAVNHSTKRIEVEVRDSSGNTVRRIPATEALDIAAGAAAHRQP